MRIRAIALDFDGVLTTGTFTWALTEPDSEAKTMSFRDRTGVANAVAARLPFAIITSAHPNGIARRYAERFGGFFYDASGDKAEALRQFAAAAEVELSEIAYMGDDEADIQAMHLAGLSGAPRDALPSARDAATFKSDYSGGNGAVRQFIDTILRDYQ